MPIPRSNKIAIIAASGLLVLAAAAYVAWRFVTPDNGLIQVSGRIESDRVTLASKVMGRVTAIRVREGSETRLHETMALLDDRTTLAQLAESRAAVEAAASQVASARSALAVLRQEIPNAIAAAEAGLAASQASHRQAGSTADQAALDSARAQELVKDHLIDTQSAQRAALALKVAQEQRAAAEPRSAKPGKPWRMHGSARCVSALRRPVSQRSNPCKNRLRRTPMRSSRFSMSSRSLPPWRQRSPADS